MKKNSIAIILHHMWNLKKNNNNILIYGQKVDKVENDGTKIEKFGI